MYGKALGILLAVAAILHGGWKLYDAGVTAGKTEIRADNAEKENKLLQESIEATRREQERNSKLSGELAIAQDGIRKRDTRISNLENKYATLAQRGNACNLSIGSVLLHNASLGYQLDPGQLDAEGGAVSTITGEAFIEHCNRLGTAFELQRTQLNNLIEAVTHERDQNPQ